MVMKVRAKQLFWFGFSYEIGIALLLTMTPTIKQAGQDAWLAVVIAGFLWLLLGFLHMRLSLLNPKKTLFEVSEWLLGKWVGKIVMVPYVAVFLAVTGIFIRQFSDFIHLALFNHTPLWALVIPFILLALFSVQQGGIEGIARSSEVIGPIIFITFFLVIFLDIGNMHWNRLLPIYADHGAWPIFLSSFPILSFLGESVILTMIVPFVDNPQEMMKPIFHSSILTTVSLIASVITSILTFSAPLAEKLLYPAYETVRYVSTMEFLQNIDALVVVIWFFSYFIKLTTYFFVSSYGISQWMGINNWKTVSWFIGVIALVISLAPPTFNFASFVFPRLWVTYVLPIHMVFLPALLLTIGLIKQSLRSRSSSTG